MYEKYLTRPGKEEYVLPYIKQCVLESKVDDNVFVQDNNLMDGDYIN